MITITLPPELEQAFSEQAEQQGTTPELLALDVLYKWGACASFPAELPQGATLADALADYIGAVSTRDKYPTGSTLSENTGRKFAAGMMKKHQAGKL